MYIVITGTTSGIGFELTRLLSGQGHKVLAVGRNIKASPLKELEGRGGLTILPLDITDKDADKEISEAAAVWPCVDVLINNAGVYRKDGTREEFAESFLVNSIMPFFITKNLMPLLKKSEQPLALQVSSMMGSMSQNTSGGSYSYRSSKAALNAIFKSLSVDEDWLKILLIHPGWVQTKMGGEAAPVTPQQSAEGISQIIRKSSSLASGSFLDYQGKHLDW